MFKRFAVALMSILLLSSFAGATDAEDVKLPDTMKAGNVKLLLNGSGIRTKRWFKLYVGGLYLKEPCGEAEEIVAADEEMGIKLHITSRMITSKRMSKATNEGFVKATNGNIEPIKEEIEEMISVFSKKIRVDDVYDMIYEPAKGTSIYKAGRKMTTIRGLPFKKALFGIWIGDKPAQEALKSGMLGS